MPLPSSIGRVKAAALAAAAARRKGGAIFLGRLGRVKVRKTMPPRRRRRGARRQGGAHI